MQTASNRDIKVIGEQLFPIQEDLGTLDVAIAVGTVIEIDVGVVEQKV